MAEQLHPSTASAQAGSGRSHPSSLRVRAFRVVAGITGVLFLLLAVSNALSPWAEPTASPGDAQPELQPWFAAMSGATDIIGAICLLALAVRPRGQELLAIYFGFGIAIAAIIVVPFTPAFIVLLLVFVPVLALYPYRSELAPRSVMRPRPPRMHLAVAACPSVALLAVAGVALGKQIAAADSAARAGSWAEYAEHAVGLALASCLAVSLRPGWRVLRVSCALAWLYLGIVATVVLPEAQGSWGLAGGTAALAVGLFYAVAGVAHRQPTPGGHTTMMSP
jgi:hypothetical protein